MIRTDMCDERKGILKQLVILYLCNFIPNLFLSRIRDAVHWRNSECMCIVQLEPYINSERDNLAAIIIFLLITTYTSMGERKTGRGERRLSDNHAPVSNLDASQCARSLRREIYPRHRRRQV